MKPILVPTVKTSCSLEELTNAFVKGYFKAFGIIPTKETISVLFSQVGIENGGVNSLYNYCLGNVKVGDVNKDYPEQQWYCKRSGVWEIINGKKIVLDVNDPGAWFRSFPDLVSGVAFHLNYLKFKRYASAWSAVESGNIPAFAHLLKIKMYYTAPEVDYIKGMMYWANIFFKHPDWYNNAVKELAEEGPISENLPTEPMVLQPPLDSSDEELSTDLHVDLVWEPEIAPDHVDTKAPDIQKTFWQRVKSLI